MPEFIITIPPGQGVRVMNALCDHAGTTPTQANALAALRGVVVEIVRNYERDQAVRAAIIAVADPTPVTPT
jgi:hypothetical protein